MARIRSVHPGLFTDENFVSVSSLARLLWIGIWTDADDYGAFEWKPLSLKMKIFPADSVDVPELLDELVQHDLVRRYEHKGKAYGLVRNFTKWQRPKKPASKHFIPAEFRTFVGLSEESSEPATCSSASISEPVPHQFPTSSPPVPNQFRTSSEKSPQMEDGGWRMEDGEEKERGGANAQPEYVYSGQVIRLKAEDLGRWRKAYHAVPDLMAEIEAADAYYAEKPPPNGKWFFAASNWLKKAHQDAVARKTRDNDDDIYAAVL